MSQFAFLQAEFPDVFGHAARAETLAHADPRGAAFYCRLALETAVGWLYRHDGTLKNPYDPTLAALLAEPSFQALVGRTLAVKARFVKDTGNAAVHGKPVSAGQAAGSLREFFHIAYWLARTYARGREAAGRCGLPHRGAAATSRRSPPTTLAQLQEVARRFKETVEARDAAEAARRVSEEGRAALEAEIKALQAEIAAAKAANQAIADTHDYREAETRDLFIDLLLREAGFDPKAPDAIEVEVQGHAERARRRLSSTTCCAATTASRWRWSRPSARARTRASASSRPSSMPTAWRRNTASGRSSSTRNGYEHWIWDDTRYPPRPIQGFLKKDELALMIQRRETRKPLAPEDIDRDIVERFYQERAIRRVAEAFERDKQRKALLVMATGAGKTRTVIALADLLDARELGASACCSSPTARRW